jgi:hypothetical protein
VLSLQTNEGNNHVTNLAVSKRAHKLPKEDQKGFGEGGGDMFLWG